MHDVTKSIASEVIAEADKHGGANAEQVKAAAEQFESEGEKTKAAIESHANE